MKSGSVVDERSVYEIAFERFYNYARSIGKVGVVLEESKLIELLECAPGIVDVGREEAIDLWSKQNSLLKLANSKYIMPFNSTQEGKKPKSYRPNLK